MAGSIIVAGGLGVLGRSVVATLAARGHRVAVVDLAPADGGAATPAALTLGGIDLTDETAVAAAYGEIARAFGGIDGLVNATGGFLWETVADGDLASWDRMYAVNLRTAVISSRAALPHLRGQGAAIVNVGAAAATAPGVGMAPYAAAKAGLAALTESLAEELRGRVRVNAVLPTIIDTPANRADMPDADTAGWVRPEAAARVIAFLLSAEAGAVTGVGVKLSLAG